METETITLLEELCVSNGPVQNLVPATTTSGGDLTDSTGICWVARAVYGEQNLRWMIFRQWLLSEAPSWFRQLYIRHGQSFARLISPHSRIKSVIRSWMDYVIGAH